MSDRRGEASVARWVVDELEERVLEPPGKEVIVSIKGIAGTSYRSIQAYLNRDLMTQSW